MIYAVESRESLKNGMATVILFSLNNDKREEDFLLKISRGTCFQWDGVNLYIVCGKGYQIVAGLKTFNFEAEHKPIWSDWKGKIGLVRGIRLLFDVKAQPVFFDLRDTEYDPEKVIDWNMAQLSAFRKVNPRVYKACYYDPHGGTSMNKAEIRELIETLNSRKELFKDGKDHPLQSTEIFGLTFVKQSDVYTF